MINTKFFSESVFVCLSMFLRLLLLLLLQYNPRRHASSQNGMSEKSEQICTCFKNILKVHRRKNYLDIHNSPIVNNVSLGLVFCPHLFIVVTKPALAELGSLKSVLVFKILSENLSLQNRNLNTMKLLSRLVHCH